MARYQITATRKDGADPDYAIDAFKVEGKWFTLSQMIAFVDRGEQFFVTVSGYTVDVFKRIHPRTWRHYLTTERDGYPYNNLLNLPSW